MKKVLLSAVVALAATNAHASKARTEALSSAAHLSDIQYIFGTPAILNDLGQWATFETGASPEAGFSRKLGNGQLAFYLGHNDGVDRTDSHADLLNPENPFNVLYASKAGEISWGVNFGYSSSDKKAVDGSDAATVKDDTAKQSYMRLTGSFVKGAWNGAIAIGLANTATSVDTGGTPAERKYTAGSPITLSGGYKAENMYYYGSYAMSSYKYAEDGTDATDDSTTKLALGFVNSNQFEGGQFFYGLSYNSTSGKEKVADSKTEESSMPFVMGVEADAASWLVLRGSLTQNFLIGSSKVADKTNTVANNTTVAAGVGIKFNKFTLDGTLAGASTGTVDGGSLLSKASLTYVF